MALQNSINGGFLSLDAFYRGRVSQPFTLGDFKFTFDKRTDLWDERLVGTGGSSYTAADATVAMTTAALNDAVVRQTYQSYAYQPGKSQLAIFTFDNWKRETNVVKRAGLMDSGTASPWTPTDGIFLEVDGTTRYWKILKASVAESAAQADWNIDKLDGTGPSKITLSDTYSQIAFIDFEHLGMGTVRCGFFIDGVPRYCHAFHHSNRTAKTWIANPNLPMRYEIRQTGAGSGGFGHVCGTIISEGGSDPTGIVQTHDTNIATFSSAGIAIASGATHAILGVRLQTGRRATQVFLSSVQVAAASSVNFRWALNFNPTVAGTFTYAAKTGSNCDVATGTGTGAGASTVAEVSQGTPIASGFATQVDREAAEPINNARRLGIKLDGVQETVALMVTNLGAASADFRAKIAWREVL